MLREMGDMPRWRAGRVEEECFLSFFSLISEDRTLINMFKHA